MGKTAWELAEAIRNRTLVAFTYDGQRVAVEPYAIGTVSNGHQILNAWRFGVSGAGTGWQVFEVQRISLVVTLAQTFEPIRSGYVKSGFAETIAEA